MFKIVEYTRPGGVARRSGSRLLICRSRFDSERPHFSPRQRRKMQGAASSGASPTRMALGLMETAGLDLAAGPHRLAVKVTALSRL
jgi:hypothetical protein